MEAMAYPFSLTNQPVLGYYEGSSSANGAGRRAEAVAEKRQTTTGIIKPGSTRMLYGPANRIIIGF